MDERLQNARNIIFDVGNVLLSFDPAKVITLLPQEVRETMLRAMFGPEHRWGGFDLGARSNEDIAQDIAAAAGIPGAKDMVLFVLSHFHETMGPMPLYHMIPDLKAAGKHLYALTNYPEPSFSLAYEAFPNLRLLEGIVVSSREKLIKPQPEIYRLIADRYRLTPSETLFIDDSASNAEGAAREGFQTWHYFGCDRIA
ncbi:MAG: HAD-IA family hydrolase [Clostridia bacterium]|nr:HAD-IA family hydrolase [Clostridia bacterium]